MSDSTESNEEELSSIFDDKDLVKPRKYPRMPKKTKKIVKYIESQLGGQILDLELTPAQIKEVVDQAFEEIVHYMTDTYTVTVPFAKCIDLSEYNIDNVESVMRNSDSILGGLPLQYTALNYMSAYAGSTITDYTDYLTNLFAAKRNLNIISTDLDFIWDKPNRKLYVNVNSYSPTYVTIKFKPEYYSVEDIRETYWETQLKKLALGMCKIILGRIRSKYTSSSAKYQLDGNTLLAEGTSEVENVRNYLSANKDIFTVLN